LSPLSNQPSSHRPLQDGSGRSFQFFCLEQQLSLTSLSRLTTSIFPKKLASFPREYTPIHLFTRPEECRVFFQEVHLFPFSTRRPHFMMLLVGVFRGSAYFPFLAKNGSYTSSWRSKFVGAPRIHLTAFPRRNVSEHRKNRVAVRTDLPPAFFGESDPDTFPPLDLLTEPCQLIDCLDKVRSSTCLTRSEFLSQ